jgi:hypothetical protein
MLTRWKLAFCRSWNAAYVAATFSRLAEWCVSVSPRPA